jgi:hypothetical protein
MSVYLDTETPLSIQTYLTTCTLNPESLSDILKTPNRHALLYTLVLPTPISPVCGWGFSAIVTQRNAIKLRYAQIIQEEKEMRRAYYWRTLFWYGVILRLRIQQFQARYWGPGGAGYARTRESFEALQSGKIEMDSICIPSKRP